MYPIIVPVIACSILVSLRYTTKSLETIGNPTTRNSVIDPYIISRSSPWLLVKHNVIVCCVYDVCVSTYIYNPIYIHVYIIYIYIYVYIYIIYTQCTCGIYIYIFVCTYACMCVYVCMYACMHVRMYVRTYAWGGGKTGHGTIYIYIYIIHIEL